MSNTWTAIVLGLGAVCAGCAGDGTAIPGGDPGDNSTSGSESQAGAPGAGGNAVAAAAAFLSPLVAALPPGLDTQAWRRVSGLEAAAVKNCGVGSGDLVTCTFALPGDREARVIYRSVPSLADARFDCEARAGVGAVLVLDGGPARWTAGDTTFTATNQLCFATQIGATSGIDHNESFRVATALAVQMGSPESAVCDGVDCGNTPF